MTQWPSHNPQPSEGINNPRRSTLGEFAMLALGMAMGAALLAGLLALLAGWLAPYIPFSWEERATRAFASDSAADSEAETALRRLGNRLAADAELPEEIRPRFHLIESPMANAFATFGGHIVVTSELVRQVSSENALSMVVAHEIAHVAKRHPIATLTRTAVFQLVWTTVVGGGNADIAGITGRAGHVTGLSFNRDMERAADRAALATLQRHYGHARGANEFFKHMAERRDETEWQSFFASHPATQERIAAIDEATDGARERPLTPLPPALEDL